MTFSEFEFLIIAIIGAIGIALNCGILSPFVFWRKMGYFGDSLAHSSLLGINIGLILHISTSITIIISSVIFGISLTFLTNYFRKDISEDILLGILSHGFLSLGILLVYILELQYSDIHSYLFGDIFLMSYENIVFIYAVLIIIAWVFYKYWDSLILYIAHTELAEAEGISAFSMNQIITLSITAIIALSVQIIGVIIITSLLIIPPAIAKQFANSAKEMVVYACLVGLISVISGISLSLYFDIPSSPTIVVVQFLLFFCSFFIKCLVRI